MARNEKLETKIREALAGVANVEEKKMFRGMAFIVNNKLCVSAGDAELMFRIDPALHDTLVEKGGCREMLRNGRAIKGYLYVSETALKTKTAFAYWMALALEYNKRAKASTKKRKH